MTAPPTQRPVFTAAPYISPASTTAHATTPWPATTPITNSQCNAQRPRKSSTKMANRSKNGNAAIFITVNKPDDFRERKIMTKVRRQAMDSYLKQEKKTKNKARKQSEENDSVGSRASVGSDQQDATGAVMSRRDALNIFYGDGKKPEGRLSPPVQLPAFSSGGHRTETTDAQVLRIPRTLDNILSAAPMFQPPRPNIPLPYMETRPGPFQSIGKPLDPFRAMFQAHDPRVSVEDLKFYCSRAFGTRAMGQLWIPTLIKSPHAYLSTLCIASTHRDAIQNREVESIQTTALRQEVIHLIHRNILDPQRQVDDFNIVALTQLITSEMIAGEYAALTYHEEGIEKMVKMRGGLAKLGVNGTLASTLSWVSLESAILREARPRTIYSQFCASHSSKTYPNTATIPESPLFAPRPDLRTIERSSRCSPQALKLLKDIRMMLDLFHHETNNSRQNSDSLKNLYRDITTKYPSAEALQQSNVLAASDWTYEAIRIVSALQATAIIKRIPLSEALKHAAEAENTTSFYSSIQSDDSNESLLQTIPFRHDSVVTSYSTPSSYATSPAFSQPAAFGPQRPSIASDLSDLSFCFPPPARPTPSGPTALLTNLKTAIENSNLSECWSDMAGVLLWVSLVTGAASRKSDKVLRKWFSALAVRCSIMLCFEHPGPIHATLFRMSEIIEDLGYPGKGQEAVVSASTAVRNGSARKRRKGM